MKIDNSNHVKFFDISFLSLQGNKSISGGEGGAILTDDENIYSKMINNHHPGHRLNKSKRCGRYYRFKITNASHSSSDGSK